MRTKTPSSTLEGDIFQTETDSETKLVQNLLNPASGHDVFMSQIAQFPYKLAVLNDANGDPLKRWCISFYVWNDITKKLVRKQLWISAKFKTKAQKQAEANRKIKQINQLLSKGYHIGAAKPIKETHKEFWTVLQAIQWVEARKTPSIRRRSKQSFKLFYTEFKGWLQLKGLQALPLRMVNYDHLESYLAWVRLKRKVGNRTYNNYLTFVKLTFNYLVKNGKLDYSPAIRLERLKEEESTNVAFPEEIKKQLLTAYQEEEPALGIFVRYIYYTFIRPKELRMLRVSNVQEQTIYIPGSASKNRKSEHVVISPALEKMLQTLGVRQAPAHWYLIGLDGKPSPHPVSTNHFTGKHLQIRRALQLPEIYTLYCWKHTGVTDTYRQTLDIEFVSRQCRHSSLDMTKRYLRGLGLVQEYPLRDQLPDLGL